MRKAWLFAIVLAGCGIGDDPTNSAQQAIVPHCLGGSRLCDCGCQCFSQYACFPTGKAGAQQCVQFCAKCTREPNGCGGNKADLSPPADLTSPPPDLTSAPDLGAPPSDLSTPPPPSDLSTPPPSDLSPPPPLLFLMIRRPP